MKISDFKTILNYADCKENNRIIIQIRYSNGTIENCDIESFSLYSDCLRLNINTETKTL